MWRLIFVVSLAGMMGLGFGTGSLPSAQASSGATDVAIENAGFEDELSAGWEKRTPDDASRQTERIAGEAHSGRWAVALENRAATFTRLRQGGDRRVVLPAGSVVMLSAWVRPQLKAAGKAGIQFYAMDREGEILAQPRRDIVAGEDRWQQLNLVAQVPAATHYAMVYVHLDGATGRALFDDVRLSVVRPPVAKKALPRVVVLTDMADEDQCLTNVRSLLGEGVRVARGEGSPADWDGCEAAVVLLRHPERHSRWSDLEALLERGGRAFLDMASLAAWRGLPTRRVRLGEPPRAASHNAATVRARMAVGLSVVCQSTVTGGFRVGDCVPYVGSDGGLLVLDGAQHDGRFETLATATGKPALVSLRQGQGLVAACDVLSLREPYYSHVDAFYKYLFLANTLADPKRVCLAEYYPRKLSYTELVAEMRKLAELYPAVRFVEEGPASTGYKIYSLNLGREGAPLYWLYGATHGSEWEPAYGLLSFARHVASGRLRGTVDLDRVNIKIIPVLNPWGYDQRKRQNASGVDLNRQGDQRWQEYEGRDSTGDGVYGPADYDWKGTSPLSEPETQIYRRIAADKQLFCMLDFHGNTSATSNKLAILPLTARDDNIWRGFDLQQRVNERLQRRHLLKQTDEDAYHPYLIEHVRLDQDRPVLGNTAARGRYGVLVEVTAGYPDSYGTALQTEVVGEICRALFEAFPAP